MIGFTSISQTKKIDEKINTTLKSYDSALSVHLKKWNVYKVSAAELFNQLQHSEGENQVHLDWSKSHNWQLSLFPNDLRSSDYKVRTTTGGVLPNGANKTFEGYEQSLGGNVRLTVDVDFIYGYVESGGERYFIEPLWYYDRSAPRNLFVVYDEHDVIPRDDAKCAAHEMHERSEKLGKQNQNQEKLVGLCYDVELAIASDYLMFLDYNSNTTDVENHNIGVLNNVQGNYDDEFADELNFVIVTQFVSDCNTCDPWSNTTNPGSLLGEFRSWGNGGGFVGVTYDLAQLWTDRDLNGGVVGIAYLNAVCNNNRYQVDQDFSSTAWQLRVLVAHETGHNFSSQHDAAGSGFIMAPSVNNSNTWSAQSINSINSFVDSRNCLALCAAPAPPTASFTSNIQNICEGSDVQFFDQSTGVINTRSWTFIGGNPASSTDANPVINYQNAGTYSVSLTVTNSIGSNTETQSGYITVGSGGTNILLFDAFEDGLSNWTVENPNGNITWAPIAVGGTNFGNTAVYMDNWSLNASGQRDGLVSQSMNLTGFTNVTLSLDYAYSLYNGNTNLRDSLIIKLSTDGGDTYPNTVFEGGDNGNGSFATTQPQGQFNPTSTADWCYGGTYGAGCIVVDLSSYINQADVVLKLENVNGYGNNMFLDNITVSSDCEVILPPVTDFAASTTQGCIPMSVNFTDLSTNNPTSWSWSFPGGIPATSTAQNPTVLYTTAGTYNVTLVASNSAGSNTSFQGQLIQVEDTPTSVFDYTSNGTIYIFNNLSTGGTNYTWFFGDGNSSNEVNPVYDYGAGGAYEVTLIVTNDCGVATSTQTINIVTQPVADFDATPTSGCIPLTVQFNDQSSTNVTGWSWNFPGGDPATSTDQNPSVIYNAPGVYSVDLTVINSSGADIISQADYITVNDVPSASFTQVINGLMVDFTNTTTNANSYSWDFGDGNSSSDINPTHSYVADGSYDVVLTATNDCGSVTASQTVTISTLPSADFGANVTSGCAPLTIQFNDLSSANTTSWLWSFPGGNPSTSNVQNPVVGYNSAGVYSVTLVASNSTGDNTITFTNYITIDDIPFVGFSQNTNGLEVIFTNTTVNGNTYNWDFGDGNSSSETNPIYTYAADGNYNVVLTATNDCGSVTASQTVTISTLPSADFGANVTSGCVPLTIQFNDLSSSNTTSWLWSLPGGNPSTSNVQNPVVVYNSAGVYSVTLIASNSTGDNTITFTNYITIDDVPFVGFSQNTNGLEVTLTNTTTNANSYSWDFGDGNSSSETNPIHTYAADGNYNVVLTATNNCGSVTGSQTVTISTLPSADFGANVTSGCIPLTVQFNDLSSSNTTSWLWSFSGGNPATSTDQSPVVVYNSVGVYSVTLVVSNSTGDNTITFTDYITVDDVPFVGFSQNTNGLEVTLTNTSTNANSYNWDFGDGNSSSATNPVHTYAADGNYNVVLTATNSCGSATETQTVNISNLPSAGFGANVTSGCADLTVQFLDQSSSNTTGWNWSFPGGNPSSSTDQNPTVTYNNAGTYSVTLEATNAVGTSTVTQMDYIFVDDVPAVSFSQIVDGLNVDFTNTSTNGNSYNWDFGDGNTSPDFSPSHTYAMDGVYDVVLAVTNNCGTVATTTIVTIVTPPSAGFGANVTSGCADLTVQFSDQSSSNATSWSWSFIGGNPSSSTEQNPTVIYENAGTYAVTLTVTNAAGNSTVEQMNYIVVDDVPVAAFTVIANAYNVDFTNTTTNATSYSWNFGDGNTSNETNPSHTYGSDGMYDVVLTATNNCGSVTFTQIVTIANAPTANWTSGASVGCADFTIQFQDQSSGNTTAWEWTFEGGTPATSTEQNPVIVYNSAGTFSVTLVAINNQGTDTTTLIDYVAVDSTPNPGFTSSVNGPLVNFDNLTTNANSYSWDFGDGNTSSEFEPNYQYSLNGEYMVTLTATNDCGFSTITQTVSITSSVAAGFSSSIASGCLPFEVQFNNESINATSFEWTFIGGIPANSTLENPLVTYENVGVYTVMLTVTNATGSSSIVETGFVVVEGIPFASFGTDINDLTVDFTNFSSSGDTFLWNFGDGSSSTEANPQYTYSAIGIYTVTLTTSNDCGSNVFTSSLDVGTVVTAGFFAENTEGCAPLQVQFIDESSNNVTEWNWTFTGGIPASSTAQNPLVNYNTPGVYEVTLVASNPFNSNTVTETNYITILPEPTASFTLAENGNVVGFVNTSTNADTYFWTFGDGETSVEESPSHTYLNDGNYTVILEAMNACGTVTTQVTMSILTPVIAGFTVEVTSGCAGLEVQFADASSSNVTGWNWTFVGGTPSTSTEQNPTVIYNNPGTYSVVLEVNNPGFNATQTEMNFIVIVENPMADFTSITTGGIVDFTNTSTNATSYSWDFGDGETSMDESPAHNYSTDGNYTVTLTATNACGSITTEIDVIISLPPVANFSLETSFNCAPATIQFINESSPNATEWFWTFDGGSPSTATVENPAITFNGAGTHTVILMASNAAGSNTFSIEITLGGVPVIDFGSSVNELTTTFTNQTMNGITFFWDLGDGNSSVEENPIHTYDEPGNYTVTLTATNACGTTTFSQQVEVVGGQAVAGFSSSGENGCLPFTVTYEDTSTGNPTSWNWSFSGGTPSTSTEQNPTVVYNSAGTFDVNLEVANPAGTSTIEQTNYITVGENPIADFIATVSMNGNIDFANNSNFGNSYEWIFGDGSTSTENSPSYTYDTAGLYTIQLIVTNNCGTDTMTQDVLIDITGVEDLTFLEKFDLYPNPNNGDFTLHIEGQPLDELEVSLYNILGQQIFQERTDFTSGQLIKDYKLSHLAAATYILQIKSANQMIHRKVVKK
jgi:PKD repeat protein